MTAAELLRIWRAECERAPGGVDKSLGKGLFLTQTSLVLIGGAIEQLAGGLPHAQTIKLGSIETSESDATSGALWLPLVAPELHVHDVAAGLVQRAEFIRDLIADALQHDIDHGLGVESAMPPFRSRP